MSPKNDWGTLKRKTFPGWRTGNWTFLLALELNKNFWAMNCYVFLHIIQATFWHLPYIEYSYMANWGSENDRNVNYRQKCYLKFVRNFVPTWSFRMIDYIWIRILFSVLYKLSSHKLWIINYESELQNGSLGIRQTAKNEATPIKTLATTPSIVVWIDWILFRFNGLIIIIYRLVKFFHCRKLY